YVKTFELARDLVSESTYRMPKTRIVPSGTRLSSSVNRIGLPLPLGLGLASRTGVGGRAQQAPGLHPPQALGLGLQIGLEQVGQRGQTTTLVTLDFPPLDDHDRSSFLPSWTDERGPATSGPGSYRPLTGTLTLQPIQTILDILVRLQQILDQTFRPVMTPGRLLHRVVETTHDHELPFVERSLSLGQLLQPGVTQQLDPAPEVPLSAVLLLQRDRKLFISPDHPVTHVLHYFQVALTLSEKRTVGRSHRTVHLVAIHQLPLGQSHLKGRDQLLVAEHRLHLGVRYQLVDDTPVRTSVATHCLERSSHDPSFVYCRVGVGESNPDGDHPP